MGIFEADCLREETFGVTKPAFGGECDHFEGVLINGDPFFFCDALEFFEYHTGRNFSEVKSLASRSDRVGNFVKLGRCKDKHNVRGRLLECFEEGVPRAH